MRIYLSKTEYKGTEPQEPSRHQACTEPAPSGTEPAPSGTEQGTGTERNRTGTARNRAGNLNRRLRAGTAGASGLHRSGTDS